MEPLTMHDLTAAYALDALDAKSRARYEEHLATCEVCREQLAQLERRRGRARVRGRVAGAAAGASLADPRRGARRAAERRAAASALAAGRRHGHRRGRRRRGDRPRHLVDLALALARPRAQRTRADRDGPRQTRRHRGVRVSGTALGYAPRRAERRGGADRLAARPGARRAASTRPG